MSLIDILLFSPDPLITSPTLVQPRTLAVGLTPDPDNFNDSGNCLVPVLGHKAQLPLGTSRVSHLPQVLAPDFCSPQVLISTPMIRLRGLISTQFDRSTLAILFTLLIYIWHYIMPSYQCNYSNTLLPSVRDSDVTEPSPKHVTYAIVQPGKPNPALP